MNDVTNKEGRTVLFVSHNMSAVKIFVLKEWFCKMGT